MDSCAALSSVSLGQGQDSRHTPHHTTPCHTYTPALFLSHLTVTQNHGNTTAAAHCLVHIIIQVKRPHDQRESITHTYTQPEASRPCPFPTPHHSQKENQTRDKTLAIVPITPPRTLGRSIEQSHIDFRPHEGNTRGAGKEERKLAKAYESIRASHLLDS